MHCPECRHEISISSRHPDATQVETRATRKRHFRMWLILFAVCVVAAVTLPTLAGVVRLGLADGLLTGVAVLVMGCGLVPLYLIGLLGYAGALFEWKSFVNSRRMRRASAKLGPVKARKFYMTLASVAMGGTAAVALIGTFVIVVVLLVAPARKPRGFAGARTPRQSEEGNVTFQRQKLDQVLARLQPMVARADEFRAKIKADPDNIVLRHQANQHFDGLTRSAMNYRNARNSWEASVRKLAAVVNASGKTSQVLDENRKLPPELDFSPEQLDTTQFPAREVRAQLARHKLLYKKVDAAIANPRSDAPTRLVTLERLAKELTELQKFFQDLKNNFGFTAVKPDEQPASVQLKMWKKNNRKVAQNENPPTKQPKGDSRQNGRVVNLLEAIDPSRDRVLGIWSKQNGTLISPPARPARLTIPYNPPASYELTAVVERIQGKEAISFGLVVGGRDVFAIIDGYGGGVSGLSRLDGKTGNANESTHHGSLIANGRNVIVCTVGPRSVKVVCNGKTAIDWQGDPNRLSLDRRWRTGPAHRLRLNSWGSRYRISKLELKPLTTPSVK